MKAMLLASLSALTLAACAAGPEYATPAPPPKAELAFASASAATTAQTRPTNHWWRMYRDPVLDGLVGDALAANTDLRVAVARLERAQAALRGAKTDREPQVKRARAGIMGVCRNAGDPRLRSGARRL